MKNAIPLIGVEEHYVPQQFIRAHESMVRSAKADLDLDDLRFFLFDPRGAPWREPLEDRAERRLRAMDEAGIMTSILSTIAPGVQLFEPADAESIARDLNDELAGFIKETPSRRFAGLAVVPVRSPESAAKEIQRAKSLGLSGVVIYSHTEGEYLDNSRFGSILASAEHEKMPIFLHPRNPPRFTEPMLTHETGFRNLASGIWGFAMETSLHALRLLVNGVFDRYPNLQVLLGHLGEGLPYWLYRLDYMYERGYRKQGTGLAKRLPSEYIRDNFHFALSGLCDHWASAPTLEFCVRMVGADRLLFATDYPFQNSKEASDVLHAANITEEDRLAIAGKNAERLFALQARRE